MTFEEELLSPLQPKKTYLLNSIKVTSFSGKSITIPKYDIFPPYFPPQKEYHLTWSEPPKFDELSIPEDSVKSFADKYNAKSYGQLLSDEKANRQVLNWLQKFQENKKFQKIKSSKKKKNKKNSADEVSAEDGKVMRSSHILIISGPSGCGKSTLVRVVASRCGYHVIELNASEDIKSERNHILLQNTLDFEPVFGKKTKPLLVLEEMDGLGTMNDTVLKTVSTLIGRPVIIIVNNLYAPALRSIRNQAEIVRMDHPPSSKFISRLRTIAQEEEIEFDAAALVEIAEQSKYDMRTALNTLQFLSIRQPITAQMVQLMPVGVKNATFTYFDIMEQLFTLSSKLEDSLQALESFGDNQLVSIGILENLGHVKSGYGNRKIADVLDNLSWADTAYGDIAQLAYASVPKLAGVNSVNRQIQYPTDSFTSENTITRNKRIYQGKLRDCGPLLQTFLNPDQQLLNVLSMRDSNPLRQEFASFHKSLGITYTKTFTGNYDSSPDIDSLISFDENNAHANYRSASSRLNKFREMMVKEMERERHTDNVLASSGLRIEDKLSKKSNFARPQMARDFFGNVVEMRPSQFSLDKRATLYYRYNEGFTNAVKRKVMLNRILANPS